MNKMQKSINKTIELNISLPTSVIKNKVLTALIDMFVHVTIKVDSENNRMLYSHRDTKMIKSAGGSGYCVY